jgi:hypothetical protein
MGGADNTKRGQESSSSISNKKGAKRHQESGWGQRPWDQWCWGDKGCGNLRRTVKTGDERVQAVAGRVSGGK